MYTRLKTGAPKGDRPSILAFSPPCRSMAALNFFFIFGECILMSANPERESRELARWSMISIFSAPVEGPGLSGGFSEADAKKERLARGQIRCAQRKKRAMAVEIPDFMARFEGIYHHGF